MTSTTLRKLIAGTALAALVALPASFAAATSDLVGATIGKTAEEITKSLTDLGYEVKKVKPEDGLLEAYAKKDGVKYEVYVDPATGLVSKVKDD